mgnify:CR=1 FL=1
MTSGTGLASLISPALSTPSVGAKGFEDGVDEVGGGDAVVEETCASAAYYIAAAADNIYVDKASLVGSIGVLMDGFGFTGLMEKLGVERRLMTAGENKALLDPFSPQDDAQKAYIQTMLGEIHAQFITVVKKGRGDRLKIWRRRWMRLLDKISIRATLLTAPISPVLSRIVVDGAYLRAAAGVFASLPTIAAVAVSASCGPPTQNTVPNRSESRLAVCAKRSAATSRCSR